MAKLEIEFEITGVKLRIKGESDDVVARATDVQRRLQGAVQALSTLGDGAIAVTTPQPLPLQISSPNGNTAETSTSQSSRGRKATRRSTTTRTTAEAVELNHDAETYGLSKEEWNTATKAMWLLYILEKQANLQEASAGILVETFNKYFRRFGAIRANNVSRDLANAQARSRTVANNANNDPHTWYLLDSGKKEVEALLKSATAAPAQ